MASTITQAIYNGIFRRNQTFLGVVFFSAFAFEMAFDTGTNKLWDFVNQGRQWKDIKYRYMQANKDDDEDDE